MLASEVFKRAWTDHLHHERRDNIGLDVLDLQNLLAVLLRHRSQLSEAGHHSGVQQAEGTEEKQGFNWCELSYQRWRRLVHSLFLRPCSLGVNPGF